MCRKDASTEQYLIKEIMKGLGGFGVVFLLGCVGLGWVFKDFTDRGVSRYQETLSTSGIMPLSGSFFLKPLIQKKCLFSKYFGE